MMGATNVELYEIHIKSIDPSYFFLFSLPLVNFIVEQLMLLVNCLLRSNIVTIKPGKIVLNLELNLLVGFNLFLVLVSEFFHDRGADLLNSISTLSVSIFQLASLWDIKEINLRWQRFQHLQF